PGEIPTTDDVWRRGEPEALLGDLAIVAFHVLPKRANRCRVLATRVLHLAEQVAPHDLEDSVARFQTNGQRLGRAMPGVGVLSPRPGIIGEPDEHSTQPAVIAQLARQRLGFFVELPRPGQVPHDARRRAAAQPHTEGTPSRLDGAV